MKYLCIPIHYRRLSTENWKRVEEHFEKVLCNWCQMFSFAQPIRVSTPVVYLFGRERSRAKNSKVMQEHTEHKGHNKFILVQASGE
jgi:hypothetical protein